MNATLALQDLRFRWPGSSRDVLDIPEFQVGAGERVMLRGPSGCGKTSLLNLAAGVTLATAGTVSMMGQSWSTLGAAERDRVRAAHIGCIFQQFNLLPYLSPLDNVLLPFAFSPERAARVGAKAQRLQAAHELLESLQLDRTLWSTPSAHLSVGQQQRVAAARALIGQPELLIADEPTSALDDDRRDAFLGLLTGLCTRSRCALLLVSHDSRLAPHFDRVVDLSSLNRAGTAEALS